MMIKVLNSFFFNFTTLCVFIIVLKSKAVDLQCLFYIVSIYTVKLVVIYSFYTLVLKSYTSLTVIFKLSFCI